MAFNLSNVQNSLSGAVSQLEGDINSSMPTNGESMTNEEMISLQFQLSQWQLATSLQTNMMKSLTDGVKSTIQNMR